VQQARAQVEVREESTKQRGEHDRGRGWGSGHICRSREGVLRNRWLQYVSYSALAWLAEGTRLLVIFQEFGHQILIGTANRARLPTKQIGEFTECADGTC
jgi:uncharacterized membrane protein YbhN (UPF0104 family)